MKKTHFLGCLSAVVCFAAIFTFVPPRALVGAQGNGNGNGNRPSGSIMVHGGGISAQGPNLFSIPYGGAIPTYRLPRSGVVQGLKVLVYENTIDVPVNITLSVDGVAVLSTSVAAGSVNSLDVAGQVPVTEGSVVSLDGSKSGATTGVIRYSVSYNVE